MIEFDAKKMNLIHLIIDLITMLPTPPSQSVGSQIFVMVTFETCDPCID